MLSDVLMEVHYADECRILEKRLNRAEPQGIKFELQSSLRMQGTKTLFRSLKMG
jgi:hypothetical protein